LLARLTTNSAVAGAPTVKSSTPTVQTSTTKGPGIMDQLGPVLALSLGKKGIDKVMSGGLESLLGGGAETAMNSAVTATADPSNFMDIATNFVDTSSLSGIEAASSGLGEAAISGISSLGAETMGEEAGGNFLTNATAIVCTESYRQGLMSQKYFDAESTYFTANPINTAVRDGYHFLCSPLVILMRKYPKAAIALAYLANRFVEGECLANPNLAHKFVLYGLFPVCWLLGKSIPTRYIPIITGV